MVAYLLKKINSGWEHTYLLKQINSGWQHICWTKNKTKHQLFSMFLINNKSLTGPFETALMLFRPLQPPLLRRLIPQICRLPDTLSLYFTVMINLWKAPKLLRQLISCSPKNSCSHWHLDVANSKVYFNYFGSSQS